jgi:MoaA/NifB/PqqE/SkfB family radical SAM enzyme
LRGESLKSYNGTRRIFSRGNVCHAPTVNINFDQSGSASVCCYNREHILGRYPENSLMDMWKGDKADQLRTFIKEGDLSHGCQMCEKQIDSGNYHGVRARYFDNYASRPANILKGLIGRSDEFQMPQCLEFELSNVCNLECTMCNGHFSSLIRKNRENLPELENPYDDSFVEQLTPFLLQLQDAKFLGGEPFLVPIYYKIWEKIAEDNPKIRIHITTNGTVYNNRVKSVLEKLKCGIIISIDSIEKETYEKIRLNANYDRVMANVHRFQEYARSTNNWFSFAVCPMTNNWKEIPDLIRYCNTNETFVCFNTVYNPEELSLQSFTSEQLRAVIEYYEAQTFAGYGFLYRQNKKVFQGVINQLKEWKADNREVD